MNTRNARFTLFATILWLLGIFGFYILGLFERPTSFNELGDFLAGVFAPVAFLWLIYGYFQNSEALQAQIEEMSESVKQQEKLANEQEAHYKRLKKSVLPHLVLAKDRRTRLIITPKEIDVIATGIKYENKPLLKFFIKNVGLDKAVFVKVILNNKIVVREISRLIDDLLVDYFLSDEEYEKLLKEKELSFDIYLNYQDIYGESFSNIYELKIVLNKEENKFIVFQN